MYCEFIQHSLNATGIETMATIEDEVVAALRSMDDRSKLFILRTAKIQAARCPAIPVPTLRLAASNFSGGALRGSLGAGENIQLSLVRSPPEQVE